MQSNTAVKVQRPAPEQAQSETKLGLGTVTVSLLIMATVFAIVWLGIFNPFMV